MTIWGGCTNKGGFLSLESLHCRAARVIFRLSRNMPSIEVLEEVKWVSLTQIYKIRLAQLAYKVYNNITPASMSHIIEKTANKYKLCNTHKVNVPRFNTYYMKSSVTYRSSVIWNVILTEFKHLETNINTFIKKCKEKKILNNKTIVLSIIDSWTVSITYVYI